jgi:YD repeat-containing protein
MRLRTTTVGFTYDNADRRATLTLPNGVVTSYNDDTASQLTGITYTLGGNPLGNLSYAYDNDRRRSSVSGSFARTHDKRGKAARRELRIVENRAAWRIPSWHLDS